MDEESLDEKRKSAQTEVPPLFPPEEKRPPPPIPDHQLLRCIGRGSYGEVWLARNMMGMFRAIKIVFRASFKDEKPFQRELSGIRKFEPISRSYEGFIDVLHVGINEDQGYFYYVMEIGDDQSVGQSIDPDSYLPKTLSKEVSTHGRLPFQDCLQLGLALSQALAELHKHGLVHRDIKPSNIIFVNGVPKLADIGLVADIGEARSYVGTEGFIPPEGPGAPQADVFSLGKVLYECSTGKDRQEFPELPTLLDELPEQNRFLELNEVILSACETDPARRYKTAWDMHADLLVLANGKSVKRLKALERRLARVKRATMIGGGVVLVAGAVTFQVYREWRNVLDARHRDVDRNVTYGQQAVDDGDYFASLVYYARALDLDKGNADREAPHRLQVGSVLSQCPRMVQMWFHGSEVVGTGFNADGSRILMVERDGKAQVFDVKTGEPRSPRFGPESGLWVASFSPDGTRVVTGSEDKSTSVWRVEDGTELLRVDRSNRVTSVRFSPDGTRIVTGAFNGAVRVWAVESGTLVWTNKLHTNRIHSAAFSPDGRLVASASEDGMVQICNAEDGRPTVAPLQHSTWVTSAVFSPDGTQLATACWDHKARVWDVKTGQRIPPDMEHEDGVKSVRFSPDGRLILTAGMDRTVRIWSTADHEPAVGDPIIRHSDSVTQAAFAPDGRRIVSCCVDGTVRVWDLGGAELPGMRLGHDLLSEDGKRLLTSSTEGLELRDVTSGRALSSRFHSISPVLETSFNKDATVAMTVSIPVPDTNGFNQTIEIWDPLKAQRIGPPLVFSTGTKSNLNHFALSQDGQRLVAMTEKIARTWNVRTGLPLSPEVAHAGKIQGASFSPDGDKVASWNTRQIKVWNATTGVEFFPRMTNDYTVKGVEFSPDGKRFLTYDAEPFFVRCSAQVWDSTTGHAVTPPLQHANGVELARFSPDARRVVTASWDHTAIVWDSTTGQPIGLPMHHPDRIWGADFSPDGKWVATCGLDKTARIWNADNGTALTPPFGHLAGVAAVQFIGDGRQIFTTDREDNSWLWKLTVDDKPISDIKLIGRLLSGDATTTPDGSLSLEKVWARLHATYPQLFFVSDVEAATWHEYQISECEREENWQAAAFHLKQIQRLRPNDTSLSLRLKLTEEKFSRAK